MATDQYHEPPQELSEDGRNFARIITSLIEEGEAISWYQQRIEVSKDEEAKKLMQHAQKEEFEHFAIDLEYLTRKLPKWRDALKAILFQEGDILGNAEKWEENK